MRSFVVARTGQLEEAIEVGPLCLALLVVAHSISSFSSLSFPPSSPSTLLSPSRSLLAPPLLEFSERMTSQSRLGRASHDAVSVCRP